MVPDGDNVLRSPPSTHLFLALSAQTRAGGCLGWKHLFRLALVRRRAGLWFRQVPPPSVRAGPPKLCSASSKPTGGSQLPLQYYSQQPYLSVNSATAMLSKSQKIKKRGNLANTAMPQIFPVGQLQLLARDGA